MPPQTFGRGNCGSAGYRAISKTISTQRGDQRNHTYFPSTRRGSTSGLVPLRYRLFLFLCSWSQYSHGNVLRLLTQSDDVGDRYGHVNNYVHKQIVRMKLSLPQIRSNSTVELKIDDELIRGNGNITVHGHTTVDEISTGTAST